MPGTEIPDNELDDAEAFDYASGAMRGEERIAFAKRLADSAPLTLLVSQWEQDLTSIQKPIVGLPPAASTWEKISAETDPNHNAQSQPSTSWLTRFVWSFGGALSSFILFFFIFPITQNGPENSLANSTGDRAGDSSGNSTEALASNNIDYIAVMISAREQPILTTLGNAGAKRLKLNWHDDELAPDMDYQLWAISKRDGETRSLAIIADADVAELNLSLAGWRLVTDAESLILTREEAGGSAIDEPSDEIVARGLCVRLKPIQTKT